MKRTKGITPIALETPAGWTIMIPCADGGVRQLLPGMRPEDFGHGDPSTAAPTPDEDVRQ